MKIFMICVFTLPFLIILNCSHNQTAFVTVDLGVPVLSVSVASRNVTSNAVEINKSFNAVKSQSSVNAPADVDQICIAVFEGDYIKENLLSSKILGVDSHNTALTNGGYYPAYVTLEVPAGDNRKFLVYGVGVDRSGNRIILRVGSSDESDGNGYTLKAGEETAVAILMHVPYLPSENIVGGIQGPTFVSNVINMDYPYDPVYNNWVEKTYKVYSAGPMNVRIANIYNGRIANTYTVTSPGVTDVQADQYSEVFGFETGLEYSSYMF